MLELLILSPHLDDAAFSLFLNLAIWKGKQVQAKVLNFFTESAYAPYSAFGGRERVSGIRRREDRRVLGGLSATAWDAGLFDAPLRLDIGFSEICNPASQRLLREDALRDLAEVIQRHACDLVLAPLAIGDHVDHWAIHKAATHAVRPGRLGFYEDLPYATWTAPAAILDRVRQAERRPLRPVRMSGARNYRRKAAALSRYSSQITRKEALNIAQYSASGRGERIWIPGHSRDWNLITLTGS